ncbi:uncharacterized protein EAF01_005546 [Botrytis porri]|uniref:Cytochrome P450 n=1 Tax=Botrytis porri TaxID=87229 RepID=A0A4Z1KWV2_9HELO|nr:uncharacterized protein EAF01_005546 [Botrytis porri]KAF7905024.1 hypothetical protein EAF01_005546 [Botrytis porri]TGO89069.1 hypothetical protein BPOR_0127g00250 [Botrytis porri]
MTTVTFTEENNEIVWQQSSAQAKGMLEYWTKQAEQPVRSTYLDTKSFTLNVLAAVMFNEVYPFEGQKVEKWDAPRLVKAREEGEESNTDITTIDKTSYKGRKTTLTKKGISSHLFVCAFAGKDTTAITLTSLLIHLAAHLDTQDWISQETNYHLRTDTNVESWKYETYFQLKRCRAVIFETLRICHPLSQLVKTTGSQEISLAVDGKIYLLPPHTTVLTSFTSAPVENPSTQDFDKEKIEADTSHHFMPFAWGQRVYPGKKFAQVELVAVLAVLFKDWRVEIIPNDGETGKQARERAWKSSLAVDHERHMLHVMFDPESVGLRWVRR